MQNAVLENMKNQISFHSIIVGSKENIIFNELTKETIWDENRMEMEKL